MTSGEFDDRAWSRLGTVLRGKYRLESVLGVGGMAVVYKATHRNQAEYAIKMLHPELSYNADLRARFLREGYAANSVKHPGVVRIVDDDVSEDGAAFLVMELLDGVVCDSLLSKYGGPLPLHAVCAIALEVLDVLAAAHAKAIIHRDIKPANLFITHDGSLKVLDFGIARVRDTMVGGAQATGTGVLLGTPAFMAPEQAIGKASDVDARADLWAVGATVFMLAGGVMVHDAETAPQLLVKLATQPARSLAAVVPDAPAAIVGVIDRALAFDKVHRWPTASAMREALASACRASFGESAPRAVLASLVAPPPAQPASALGVRESRGSGPPPMSPSPAAGELADTTWHAGDALARLAPGVVVETSRPVSTSPSPQGRRSAKGVVATLIAFATIASAIGVALAVRVGHAVSGPTVPSASSIGLAASSGTTSSTGAIVTTSRAVASARHEPSDDAGQGAVAPPLLLEAAPFGSANTSSGHAPSPPPPKLPPPQATPTSHVGQGPPAARPETPLPTATRPSAPPTAPTITPRADPLDGRR